MKNQIVKLIICLIALCSCNSSVQKTDPLNEGMNLLLNENEEYKLIDLEFGFKVKIGKEEDFGKFTTFTYFELRKNDNVIFIDNSLDEYEFGDKLYPIILKTGANKYELLFEINNRPFKNYLKRFFVENNKLIKQDELPTFIAPSKVLNNDGVMKYAGFMHSEEYWENDYAFIDYYPILYYSVTPTGLKLDSTLTIDRNEKICGKFYGFDKSSSEDSIPANVMKKFNQEIDYITNR